MADKNAQLNIEADAQAIDLPIYEGTIGPDVIDVRGLTAQGSFTFDPGFVSTAACESKITYIDGGAGVLLHRGYPIDELAEHSDYLETCYLLLFGELPNASQKQEFEATITSKTMVSEQVSDILKGFAPDHHPMAKLMAVVSALAGYYNADIDIDDEANRLTSAYQLIAQMPTLAAMCYKHGREQAYVAPRQDLSYGANFLHMMFASPDSDAQPSPVLAKAVDKVFLLHADHEQNASTSTVRLAGSTGTNPFAAITAGIAALWGPAHGGANEAVLRMLDEIGGEENIEAYIGKAKDKNDPFRLMGFGHRVYKNYDPRATVMKKACDDVLHELNLLDDPMFRMAKKLEKIALEDDYFIDKKLFPNVDFYSGIILKALGIPTDMFTVIFALGRAPGWIAHWHEMLSASYKIGRPRQLYTGPASRSFVPLDQR